MFHKSEQQATNMDHWFFRSHQKSSRNVSVFTVICDELQEKLKLRKINTSTFHYRHSTEEKQLLNITSFNKWMMQERLCDSSSWDSEYQIPRCHFLHCCILSVDLQTEKIPATKIIKDQPGCSPAVYYKPLQSPNSRPDPPAKSQRAVNTPTHVCQLQPLQLNKYIHTYIHTQNAVSPLSPNKFILKRCNIRWKTLRYPDSDKISLCSVSRL